MVQASKRKKKKKKPSVYIGHMRIRRKLPAEPVCKLHSADHCASYTDFFCCCLLMPIPLQCNGFVLQWATEKRRQSRLSEHEGTAHEGAARRGGYWFTGQPQPAEGHRCARQGRTSPRGSAFAGPVDRRAGDRILQLLLHCGC